MNNCAVVCDLLPLYADHETSPETTAYIEAHLQNCAVCRAELREINRIARSMKNPEKGGHYLYASLVQRIRLRNLAVWFGALTAFFTVVVLWARLLYNEKREKM